MNDYLSLLLSFKALPRVQRKSTFMEVAGYPHYENVCSNILRFYLNPAGEHGLKDLLLKAFLRLPQGEALSTTGTTTVHREYEAEDGKRIDLVVDHPAFILAIENKIFHWEANDLELYARTLQNLADQRPLIKVVLSLRVDEALTPAKGGFARYTYRELWQHVRDLMGHHMLTADPKWIIHLTEFMETTTRLTGETQEEAVILDFFLQHHDVIERLVRDRQALINRIETRARTLESAMRNYPETSKYLSRRWVCHSNCVASHFNFKDAKIGLDLTGDLKGWTLTLFQLDRLTNILSQLFFSDPMVALKTTAEKIGDRYVLQRWNPHVTDVELQEALINWTKALIAAADAVSAPATEFI